MLYPFVQCAEDDMMVVMPTGTYTNHIIKLNCIRKYFANSMKQLMVAINRSIKLFKLSHVRVRSAYKSSAGVMERCGCVFVCAETSFVGFTNTDCKRNSCISCHATKKTVDCVVVQVICLVCSFLLPFNGKKSY